jgi:hypothetical protein
MESAVLAAIQGCVAFERQLYGRVIRDARSIFQALVSNTDLLHPPRSLPLGRFHGMSEYEVLGRVLTFLRVLCRTATKVVLSICSSCGKGSEGWA